VALKHVWSIALACLVVSGCNRSAPPATEAEAEPEAISVTRWTDETELFAEYPPLALVPRRGSPST
jgi:hypothetical protein